MLDALNAVAAFDFQHPQLLWGVPIAAVLLFLVVIFDFVSARLNVDDRIAQRKKRVWIFVSRLFMITLILIALAEPYGEITEERQGNPRVTILQDNSGSMQFMDTTFSQGLIDDIGRSISVKQRMVGSSTQSDLGGAILQNLEPGGNILLLSDGHATTGASLEDVAFYASTINATISAINITSVVGESGIVVSGPNKVVAESENEFTVIVTSTQDETVPVVVTVDGERVLDKQVAPGRYSFRKSFSAGNHKIEARIGDSDAEEQNNVFYKVVSVLPQPTVLLVTQKTSPLELLLNQLYNVEKRSSLPGDLSKYYAVVINDLPASQLSNTQALHNYLIDEQGGYRGGGVVFFGGLNSFDRGSYSSNAIEQYLPVRAGRGEPKKSTAALVFVLDMSGSTGGARGFNNKAEFDEFIANGGEVEYSVSELSGNWMNAYYYPTGDKASDVIKAQAVNAIEQLQIDNRVGVIAFGLPPQGEFSSPDAFIEESVKIIEGMDFLYNNRQQMTENIPRITPGGPTSPDIALRGAVEMLQAQSGDKNIIFLTNGRFSAGLGGQSAQKQQLLTIAQNANERFGINFMTIGVGTNNEAEFPKKVDESFMLDLAAAGDGTYDRATQLNTLLIKWGDPKAKKFGEEFNLVPLSLTHFITRDVRPTATLNGYNEVVPKDTAQMLIAADSGQPALTVWQYGNGRVATWTAFAGSNLGQLLNADNSILVSRTVNWAIGDPQRKEAYYVEIPDGRVNEELEISVRSESVVTSEVLDFTKEGDIYKARVLPNNVGFNDLLGETYAVNRPRELDRVGINKDIVQVTELSGGKVFKPSESEAIVEHIRQASKRVTIQREVLSAPFIIAAALLLLLEIFLRRISERRS